ncbi:hypothetical protein [Paraclostridium bifermentans]|uniref:hypothetical protein n=1 Tax=Paraclostridium bifermentans TaxID=1490 RepID=UPI00359CAE2D
MYYNKTIRLLNIRLCIVTIILAILYILKVVEGVFITKMILVGLIFQQLTIAYNEYKLLKINRSTISLIVAGFVGYIFMKIR